MEEINRVTINLLGKVEPAYLKTMTFDNGREFCGHEKLSESLKLQCFFCQSISFMGTWIKRAYEWINQAILS